MLEAVIQHSKLETQALCFLAGEKTIFTDENSSLRNALGVLLRISQVVKKKKQIGSPGLHQVSLR